MPKSVWTVKHTLLSRGLSSLPAWLAQMPINMLRRYGNGKSRSAVNIRDLASQTRLNRKSLSLTLKFNNMDFAKNREFLLMPTSDDDTIVFFIENFISPDHANAFHHLVLNRYSFGNLIAPPEACIPAALCAFEFITGERTNALFRYFLSLDMTKFRADKPSIEHLVLCVTDGKSKKYCRRPFLAIKSDMYVKKSQRFNSVFADAVAKYLQD